MVDVLSKWLEVFPSIKGGLPEAELQTESGWEVFFRELAGSGNHSRHGWQPRQGLRSRLMPFVVLLVITRRFQNHSNNSEGYKDCCVWHWGSQPGCTTCSALSSYSCVGTTESGVEERPPPTRACQTPTQWPQSRLCATCEGSAMDHRQHLTKQSGRFCPRGLVCF